MYKCENCEYSFDSPKIREETHGFDHGPFEEIAVCPNCGSTEYHKVDWCNSCGKECAEDELRRGLCAGCRREVRQHLGRVLLQFSYSERMYLEDLVEGQALDHEFALELIKDVYNE